MTLPVTWHDNQNQQLGAAFLNSLGAYVNSHENTLHSNVKILNIGDLGFASTSSSGPFSTATAGTSQVKFKVGLAANGIMPLFQHWYTAAGTFLDTDPTGPITFSADIRILSSSNPQAVLNTPYRLKFGGRITATLDPGGEIAADPLGISVLPGDVIAVRTYLSSGTAWSNRVPTFLAYDVGFTPTTDLTMSATALGSGAGLTVYGPAMLLGRVDNGANAESYVVAGDSACSGFGDGTIAYRPELNFGGWAIRAITGQGGLVNAGIGGDRATVFRSTTGCLQRMKCARYANYAIIEYGAGDLNNVGINAAALEVLNLALANDFRRMGISKVFLTTIVPRTTSTDGWLTLANQTVASTESQRVAYNTWVRNGCPIDPTSKAPVAVGTSGALLSGQVGHPVSGMLDICSVVESSQNSGLWAATGRSITATISASSASLSTTNGNFNSANVDNGGDVGNCISLPGAGASGAVLSAFVYSVGSSTAATLSTAASTAVTGGQGTVGGMSYDGAHPSPKGQILIAGLLTNLMNSLKVS